MGRLVLGEAPCQPQPQLPSRRSSPIPHQHLLPLPCLWGFSLPSFGLAPAAPLQVHAPLSPNQTVEISLPLSTVGSVMKMEPLNNLQVGSGEGRHPSPYPPTSWAPLGSAVGCVCRVMLLAVGEAQSGNKGVCLPGKALGENLLSDALPGASEVASSPRD